MQRCGPWSALLTDLQSRRRLLYASQPFEKVLRAEQSQLLLPAPGVASFQPAISNHRRQGGAVGASGARGSAAAAAQMGRPLGAPRPAPYSEGDGAMGRVPCAPDAVGADRGGLEDAQPPQKGAGAGPGHKRSAERYVRMGDVSCFWNSEHASEEKGVGFRHGCYVMCVVIASHLLTICLQG